MEEVLQGLDNNCQIKNEIRKKYSFLLNEGDSAINAYLLDIAEEKFFEAKDLLPDDPDVNFKLGDLYQIKEFKNSNKSLEYFEIAAKTCKETDPHYKLAEAKFLIQGNTKDVQKLFIKSDARYSNAISKDPSNYKPILYLGIVYFYLKRLDFATKKIDQAIELNPNDPDCYFYKGEVLLKQKKYLEAIDCFKKCYDLNEKQIFALYKLACLYSYIDNHEEAINCINKAIEIDENFKKAYSLKDLIISFKSGLNLNTKGEQLIKTAQTFESTSEKNKDDLFADLDFLLSGKELINTGHYKESFFFIDKALTINPNNPENYYWKGKAFFELKKFTESIECYDLAIKLDPEIDYFYSSKADALRNIKKKYEADECDAKAFSIAINKMNCFLDKFEKEQEKNIILKEMQDLTQKLKEMNDANNS